MQKNIIFLIPSMRGGGAERVISVLSDYFIKEGHKVKIALFKDNVVEYQINPEVELDTSLIGSCGNPLKRIVSFHRFMKKEGEAVVFSFFTMIGLYILAAAFGTKAKVIISERLDPAQSIPNKRWLFALRRLLYKYASGFVFQTQDAIEFFSEDVQKKGIVIPNPMKEGLPERYTGERKKRVVTFARLEPQKNYPLLINSFAEFYNNHPEYCLDIYGQGVMEESLKQLAKDLGIIEHVHFMGFEKNVHEKVRDAQMFVLPSDYEGLSNSMLEAMAIGLPVICTDCPPGGARMFIDDKVNGLLVPIRDQQAMVAAMEYLAEYDTDGISINATKVKNELSKERICQKWLQYIASVTD